MGKPWPASPGLRFDPKERAWRIRTSASTLFASGGTRAISANSQDASSIFPETPTYNSGGEYAYSVAADVNGDGHPDLLGFVTRHTQY